MVRTYVYRSFTLLALTFSSLAYGHHAMDPKDGTPIELTGIIEYISWDGAHVMYRIRAQAGTGEAKLWQVLGASPKILSKRHITKSTMRVGEQITVNGSYNQYRNEIAPYFFVTADGRKYEMGFYPSTMQPPKQ
jgi:hypothetical protein